MISRNSKHLFVDEAERRRVHRGERRVASQVRQALRRIGLYFHDYSFPVAAGFIVVEAAVASIRSP
jgi:toxin HigB-1